MMKTAFFSGKNEIVILNKPMPEVMPGEVLVKVAYCGLCGSEKRIARSGFDKCVPGHEISGVVEYSAGTIGKFEKGMEVLIYLSNYCGKCPACKNGNTSQCIDRRGLIGWSFDGGYAEYTVVPEHMVFPLNGISLRFGVLALDTIGTAFHGLRFGNIQNDQSVLVIGCGPIGLGALTILKNHFGIKRLYAADISSYHLNLAQNIGAIPLPVDIEDTAGSIKKQINGFVDTVVEVVGVDATVAAAMKVVKPDGHIILIGEPEKELILTRSTDWVLKDFSLINTWYFPVNEITENIKFIKSYKTEIDKLITHEYPIEKMTEAFDLFCKGETGKVLINL
jgi:threonine dehydrogenase-like Zn-dependent dehydrogenase